MKLFTILFTFIFVTSLNAQDVTVTWADGYGNSKVTVEDYKNCQDAYDDLGTGYIHDGWAVHGCTPCEGGVNIIWWKPTKLYTEAINKIKIEDYDIIQVVDLTGSNGGTPKVWTDRNYDTCDDWQKAVDNGTYNPPRGYKNITCENASSAGGGVSLSGTSTFIEKKDVKIDKRKIGIAQTVELDGQKGYGNRKAWDDNRYATCKDWQKAVDNGTYDAPSGMKDIKCTDKSVSGGGISLSGTPIILDKKEDKMNRTDKRKLNIKN